MAARTIKASEFKAKCLKLMDEVNESGEYLDISKNGVIVATLMPARPRHRSLFGAHAGQIQILGDIVSPIMDPYEAPE